MRGIFALVLAAGVAAGAGLLMWEDGADEDQPASFERPEGEVHAPNPAPPPGNGDDDETRPHRLADAVLSKVRAHLGSDRADLAARAVLEDEAGVLVDARVRREVFRTADLLRREAKRASGDIATRKRLAARRLYAALYDCDASTDAELEQAFEASRELHRVLVTSAAAPDSLVMRHKFKAGENLWSLARGPWKKAGITVASGFVLKVNGISDARRIRAGQTLRIPKERLSLLVRKDRFEITVLLGDSPVERFRVGLGADDSTPEGRFEIATKLKNPPWYFNGRRIEFGDPENLIGTRWMGFSQSESAEGIGIHGTSDESTVGQAMSHGCIRMKQVDVERLFEWVPRTCEVEVR